MMGKKGRLLLPSNNLADRWLPVRNKENPNIGETHFENFERIKEISSIIPRVTNVYFKKSDK